MKGDFSRSTFDSTNHYKRVPLQQGRAQTDADANEQQAITLHRIETEAADLIGGCGGPIHAAGFEITSNGDDLVIGAGRYYVDGVLCENEKEVGYRDQVDYPLDTELPTSSVTPPLTVDPGITLPTSPSTTVDLGITLSTLPLTLPLTEENAGVYLVYCDVCELHCTALEASHIREVAFGGPDTATRTKTVWQVKLHRLTEEEAKRADCLGTIPSWDSATAPSTGTLIAQTAESEPSDDPCIVTPGAGYRRLENQLYRVEVHEGGVIGDPPGATFKWDRDNGTIVARLQSTDLEEWTVSSVGRDDVLRFAPNDWIELTDDTHELHGLPGTLVRIVSVEGNLIRVDLNKRYPTGDSVDMADFPLNPKVRRWNGVLGTVTDDSPQPLEDGVQVRLRAVDDAENDLSYRTGDYWTIPARTNTGDVEWPLDESENPVWRPAEGIHHHYCRLALAMFDGTEWALISDCRTLFPPVTELTSLFYVGGDGQAGVANDTLPNPLQVGVANGSHPVHGATIRYTVTNGDGLVNGQPEAEIATDTDGIASVEWTLGDDGEQQVEAVLLSAAGEPFHLPVRFAAHHGVSSSERGIRVEGVYLVGGEPPTPLHNDTQVSASDLFHGIRIQCRGDFTDAVVWNGLLEEFKPVCYVTLHLPYPLNLAERTRWALGDGARLGTRPLRLDARLDIGEQAINWVPARLVGTWFRHQLFEMLGEFKFDPRVLCCLTLKGNVIWSEVTSGDRLYLDGDAYGMFLDDESTTRLVYPSGEGRRGGDFELWFWLGPDEANPRISVSVDPLELDFNRVHVDMSEDLTFEVSNVGRAELRVSPSLEGDGFEITEPTDFVLASGESNEVNVRFAPTSSIEHDGILSLTSNDPIHPVVEIALKGEGYVFG